MFKNNFIFKNNKWKNSGSLNNLKDVLRFYAPDAEEIQKDARNFFVNGSPQDVIDNFQVCVVFQITFE
jgi:hypothetical protein